MRRWGIDYLEFILMEFGFIWVGFLDGDDINLGIKLWYSFVFCYMDESGENIS